MSGNWRSIQKVLCHLNTSSFLFSLLCQIHAKKQNQIKLSFLWKFITCYQHECLCVTEIEFKKRLKDS